MKKIKIVDFLTNSRWLGISAIIAFFTLIAAIITLFIDDRVSVEQTINKSGDVTQSFGDNSDINSK